MLLTNIHTLILTTESMVGHGVEFLRGALNPFNHKGAIGEAIKNEDGSFTRSLKGSHSLAHVAGKLTTGVTAGNIMVNQQNKLDDIERTKAYADNIRKTGEAGEIKNSNWHTIRTLTNKGKDLAVDKLKDSVKNL